MKGAARSERAEMTGAEQQGVGWPRTAEWRKRENSDRVNIFRRKLMVPSAKPLFIFLLTNGVNRASVSMHQDSCSQSAIRLGLLSGSTRYRSIALHLHGRTLGVAISSKESTCCPGRT